MIKPYETTKALLHGSERVLFAFRCLELLIVAAILALLASFATPASSGTKAHAKGSPADYRLVMPAPACGTSSLKDLGALIRK